MADELERLQRKVLRLQKKVLVLEQRLAREDTTVLSILRQKGLNPIDHNPTRGLLLPPNADAVMEGELYRLMGRYSFRILLRDLISHQQRFSLTNLTRYCSARTASQYLRLLEGMGLVARSGEGEYMLNVDFIPSIGATLEWFIAQVFVREFAASAMYGVKLRDTVHGGDYDVIARLDDRLAYVEVKSSPPRGVEATDVRAFYQRLADLSPDVAFFLVDTELRMKDKIVPLFEEEIRRVYGVEKSRERPALRLKEELFHVNHNVFILNSRKGVATNLRTCLRHYHKHGACF